MRDLHDLQDLKREYRDLVRAHGEEVAELVAFKRALLDLNRRHRRDAAAMYARMIARIQKKVSGTVRRR
jgi:hypothetical protein